MVITKTTQYITNPDIIPVNTSTGTQPLATALDQRVIYVDTIADLQVLDTSELVDGQQASLREPSIQVYWDSSSTSTADDVDVIKPNDSSIGRWMRNASSVKDPQGTLYPLQSFIDETRKTGVQGSDLLSKLMQTTSIDGMYFRNRGASGCAVGINMAKELNMGVEYQFTNDDDNLLLLRGILVGEVDRDHLSIEPTLNGTFNQNSAPATYTTTVGDSFSFTFTGTALYFNRSMEARGGLWRFFIKRNTAIVKRVDVSCYSSNTLINGVKDKIVSNLPFDTYDVEAVFQGEDPDFPPSSTPARGYLIYDTTQDVYAITTDNLGIVTNGIDVLTSNSVSDFAIKARAASASYGTEWVPNHGSVSGVSTNIEMKLIIDGETVLGVPGGTSSVDYKEIRDFKIVQSFNAENPNGSDGTMWVHKIVHSMNDRDYTLKVSQSIDFSQDTRIDVGYWTMLAAESSPANIDRLVLNNGFEKKPVPLDDSEDAFGLDVTQAAYLGEFEPGNYYGICLDMGSLKEAVSLGSEYEVDVPGLSQYRSSGIAKTYWKFCESVTVPAGTTLSHEGIYGAVAGVRSPNVNLINVR